MYDETPDEVPPPNPVQTTLASHAIFKTHIGKIGEVVKAQPQVDLSQYRYVILLCFFL